jgi:SNF2 family DNA or RNA helicase
VASKWRARRIINPSSSHAQPCTIYRLFSTGTIEEKILQRQLAKGELADAVGSVRAPWPAGPVGVFVS